MGITGRILGRDFRRLRRKVAASISGLAFLCAVVWVFAPAALADPPLPTIPANTFTITSFGAVGDGASNNATAIQNTINAAAAAIRAAKLPGILAKRLFNGM